MGERYLMALIRFLIAALVVISIWATLATASSIARVNVIRSLCRDMAHSGVYSGECDGRFVRGYYRQMMKGEE